MTSLNICQVFFSGFKVRNVPHLIFNDTKYTENTTVRLEIISEPDTFSPQL